MILVGIYWCRHCRPISERMPEVRYVEVPKEFEWDSEIGRIRKACGDLKVRGYPVLLADDLSHIIRYPDWNDPAYSRT